MINDVFKDLKVIELASVLAGPAVGMFFAELGAQVIKIENSTTGGDVTRQWRLPHEDKSRLWSAYYCSINYNKEVRFLNLKDNNDVKIVHKLILSADIVINNIKDSSSLKMGIDYKTLSNLNNQLIYAQLYAFSSEINRPAFDVVLQAETGYLSMSGEGPNRPSVKMPVALIDQLAAHQLKEAILIALLQRNQTNKGSFVSTTLYDSAVSSLANQASNWLNEGHIPQKMGTLHPNICPYGESYTSIDGIPFVLAIGNDTQFAKLWYFLKLPPTLLSQKYNTNMKRVQNRDALNLELKSAIEIIDFNTLSAYMLDNNIPFGRINDMKAVFDHPQAQSLVLEETIDGAISKRVKTAAFTIKPYQKEDS